MFETQLLLTDLKPLWSRFKIDSVNRGLRDWVLQAQKKFRTHTHASQTKDMQQLYKNTEQGGEVSPDNSDTELKS